MSQKGPSQGRVAECAVSARPGLANGCVRKPPCRAGWWSPAQNTGEHGSYHAPPQNTWDLPHTAPVLGVKQISQSTGPRATWDRNCRGFGG